MNHAQWFRKWEISVFWREKPTASTDVDGKLTHPLLQQIEGVQFIFQLKWLNDFHRMKYQIKDPWFSKEQAGAPPMRL